MGLGWQRTLASARSNAAQIEISFWRADLVRMQEFRSLLVDAELSQRGYLLTGEQEYLAPYQGAIERLQSNLDMLPQMVASGRLSADEGAHLKSLIDQKLAEMDQTISLEKTQGSVAAQALVRTGQGKQLMDQISQVIGKVTGQAQGRIDASTDQLKDAQNWRGDVFLFTGLVNIPFLIWAMWRIWLETGRRADLMRELSAQKEFLSVTLRSIGDGVIGADTDGRITFINSAAEELTGWTCAEAIGRPCSTVFRIISEETRQPVESPVDKVLKDGVVVGLANHTLLIRRDGSELPVDDSGAPMRDSKGVIRGVVLVFRDFTRHKRSEQNLIRAAAELESAGKAKDQFLAALSHELRTPLTPLLVTLSMLEQDGKLPAGLLEDVRMMRRNVQLEARLIDDLLDLTRIAKGKLLLNLEVVDLQGIINSVIARFERQMTGKSLNFARSFCARRHFVNADPIRIEQVLWNILQNAIKFTPPGGTISISTRNDGDGWIETSIADDGVGMEAEILSRCSSRLSRPATRWSAGTAGWEWGWRSPRPSCSCMGVMCWPSARGSAKARHSRFGWRPARLRPKRRERKPPTGRATGRRCASCLSRIMPIPRGPWPACWNNRDTGWEPPAMRAPLFSNSTIIRGTCWSAIWVCPIPAATN